MRIEKHIIKNQCIIDDLEFELNLIIILRILKKDIPQSKIPLHN